MAAREHFSTDFRDARAKFRDAATAAGARLQPFVNESSRSPSGEILATDIAWLGPENASRVLVTISGTHGVEGFFGSGVQVGSFATGIAGELAADTAMLAIHAINPSGFALLRRVTEDNVDLNRNFIDFTGKLPRNDGYVELADAICPAAWTEEARRMSGEILDAYAAQHGAAAFQQAVSGGQYTHPDGLFFGGAGPTLSRRILLHVAGKHLARARRVAVIDYHTGLGPYGHGERIVVHAPGSAGLARARAWYGETITSTALGTSASSDVVGDALTGLEKALPSVEVTGVALECGVRPLRETLEALRADNWLHHHGKLDTSEGRAIKRAIRDVFYGDADDWKDMVFDQAVALQREALRGLAG